MKYYIDDRVDERWDIGGESGIYRRIRIGESFHNLYKKEMLPRLGDSDR